MNCDQCQELLVEYSLGELDSAQGEGVDTHLAGGCAECQQELCELQEALGLLGQSLAEVPPPPAIKSQLLARIAAEKRGAAAERTVTRATAPPQAGAATGRRWQQYFAYAATLLCGFLIGALAVQHSSRDDVEPRDRAGQLAEILESARENFGSPEIRFASLRAATDENTVVGHMMWDTKGRNLHVFAFDLEPPAAQRQLAVWFVPAAGPPIYAGKLEVSADGACSAVYQAPELKQPVAQVVVTEEPEGDVSRPSGPQRIVSRFE